MNGQPRHRCVGAGGQLADCFARAPISILSNEVDLQTYFRRGPATPVHNDGVLSKAKRMPLS